jgi:ribosome-binding protein aMBF1 (putative translation factor)
LIMAKSLIAAQLPDITRLVEQARLRPGGQGGGLSTKRYILIGVESTMHSMAATVLREARQRSGLSQAELARRAGVVQSVISAYESGRRQPALPMLARLIEATGLELRLTVDQPRHEPLTGPVGGSCDNDAGN